MQKRDLIEIDKNSVRRKNTDRKQKMRIVIIITILLLFVFKGALKNPDLEKFVFLGVSSLLLLALVLSGFFTDKT